MFPSQKALHKKASAAKAQLSKRFFKTGPGEYGEGDVFIGVTVPQIRLVAAEFQLTPLLEIHTLLQSKIHEERLLALILLVNRYRRAAQSEKSRYYNFYFKNTQFINNWDLVDCSAHQLAGHFLADKDKNKLYKLAASKDLWERRIAIVSTFHFIRQGHFEDTLAISEILLNDKHDLIHKAVGWMLREVGKKDRKTLENFLNKFSKQMPRTALRYAIERFPEKTRQFYLRK